MGLFFKKNKLKRHVEEENAPQEEKVLEKDKIFFAQAKNNDQLLASYVNSLKEHTPVCLNFDLLDVKEANKALAFMTGACFALGGSIFEIDETTYLFALEENLKDGSIDDFVNSF